MVEEKTTAKFLKQTNLNRQCPTRITNNSHLADAELPCFSLYNLQCLYRFLRRRFRIPQMISSPALMVLFIRQLYSLRSIVPDCFLSAVTITKCGINYSQEEKRSNVAHKPKVRPHNSKEVQKI